MSKKWLLVLEMGGGKNVELFLSRDAAAKCLNRILHDNWSDIDSNSSVGEDEWMVRFHDGAEIAAKIRSCNTEALEYRIEYMKNDKLVEAWKFETLKAAADCVYEELDEADFEPDLEEDKVHEWGFVNNEGEKYDYLLRVVMLDGMGEVVAKYSCQDSGRFVVGRVKYLTTGIRGSQTGQKTMPNTVIAWMIVTILLLIVCIASLISNLSMLLIAAPLLLALIMVGSGSGGKGGRIFLAVLNLIFAALFLFTAITSWDSPSATACVSSHFKSEICDLNEEERAQYDTYTRVGGLMLGGYFLASGIMLFASKGLRGRMSRSSGEDKKITNGNS